MPKLNLTLIQTFYQVAKRGSFSAAARELNLSYQSAANHVRRLEQILKDRLIDSEQGAKQVTLTPRGRALYRLLDPELEVMLERLSLLLENQRSTLRIGMPQAIFYFLFPGIMAELRALHPDLELAVFERDTVLAELVASGSLDVCLSERYFGDPVMPQQLLGTYRLSLVHPRSWGPSPAPDDIPSWAIGRPLVTFEPGQTLRNHAMNFLGQTGETISPSISASGSSNIRRCVEEGLGFAIIPSWCVGAHDERIAAVPLENLPEIRVYFGCAGYLTANPYVRDLSEICRRRLVGSVLRPPSGDVNDPG
ncbi:LysR family transcriptional regulator [Pinisolibacter sp.]|uniref:LysR family transcriptional regulator n=1 Tax=Pinisolibacter sp. TaxID=2172024 RepID=UPI002FDCCE04